MSHRSNYYTLPVPSVYHYPDSSTRRFGSPGSDIDIFGRAVCRCSIQKQMHFIRKVISVTALQVLLAAGIAATLTHTEPFVEWLQESATSGIAMYMSLPWVRCMFDVDTISIMWAMVTSFVICGYTILELYFIMGYLTLDDYILANMCFYVDLLYPMRCLHNICELTDHIEIFPKILDPGPHR